MTLYLYDGFGKQKLRINIISLNSLNRDPINYEVMYQKNEVVFEATYEQEAALLRELQATGLAVDVRSLHLDMGGINIYRVHYYYVYTNLPHMHTLIMQKQKCNTLIMRYLIYIRGIVHQFVNYYFNCNVHACPDILCSHSLICLY